MKKKELCWVGPSKKDFLKFPAEIIEDMGYGLYQAQLGEKHVNAKVL